MDGAVQRTVGVGSVEAITGVKALNSRNSPLIRSHADALFGCEAK